MFGTRREKRIFNWDLPPDLLAEMEGTPPPDDFPSNGLTMAPDSIGGADLRPAGHFHDYAYVRGGTEAARKEADHQFYRNLLRCGLPKYIANLYFRRVRWHGRRLWKYSDRSRPKSVCALTSLFVSRYISW